ncbi:MAG: TetR/AcrR family transcriptional regulator [Solobacterium sp.]|nr:TetR/AcrR family transcriptional regulator [Solobacterium sp.]
MTLEEEFENNALEHITVTQQCEKSTINKTTFYQYYKNLYDLYKDVLKDIFSDGLDATYEDYSFPALMSFFF